MKFRFGISLTAAVLLSTGCVNTRALTSALDYAKAVQTENNDQLLHFDSIYYEEDSRFEGLKRLCGYRDYQLKRGKRVVFDEHYRCLNSVDEATERTLHVEVNKDVKIGNVQVEHVYRRGVNGPVILRSHFTNLDQVTTRMIDFDLRGRLLWVTEGKAINPKDL